MQPIKFIHCADIHLGAAESFLGPAAEKRRFETLLTFERILQAAEENGAPIVLIAGDLFDSNRVEPVFRTRVLEAIAAHPEIKVFYAAGNHDPLTNESPFAAKDLPENLYVFGTKDACVSLDGIGVKVYGRSFGGTYLKSEAQFGCAVSEDGFRHLMVLHGDTGDADSPYNPITPDFIRNSGMDYIALGHIHKRSDLLTAGKTAYAYCGCPEGQGFDETGEKGVYLGSFDENGLQLKFLPLATRMHLCETVDVTGCAGAAEVAERILTALREKYGESFGEHLYKIILTGETDETVSLAPDEIEARLSAAVYYLKLRDNTHPALNLAALAKEPTLKGIFVKKMTERIQNATGEETELLQQALKIGLAAFRTEVNYREDQ